MHKTLLLFSLLAMLSGCKKNDDQTGKTYTTDYPCTDIPMSIGLSTTSYTSEEMDTVIVKKYKGDNSFSQLIDTTLVVIAPDTGQYSNMHWAALESSVYGDSDDHEIVIPGAGQTYRIWNIKAVNAVKTITHQYGQPTGHFQCYEPVERFEISGGQYSKEMSYPGENFHYVILLKH